jgi:hypothetical protein
MRASPVRAPSVSLCASVLAIRDDGCRGISHAHARADPSLPDSWVLGLLSAYIRPAVVESETRYLHTPNRRSIKHWQRVRYPKDLSGPAPSPLWCASNGMRTSSPRRMPSTRLCPVARSGEESHWAIYPTRLSGRAEQPARLSRACAAQLLELRLPSHSEPVVQRRRQISRNKAGRETVA